MLAAETVGRQKFGILEVEETPTHCILKRHVDGALDVEVEAIQCIVVSSLKQIPNLAAHQIGRLRPPGSGRFLCPGSVGK